MRAIQQTHLRPLDPVAIHNATQPRFLVPQGFGRLRGCSGCAGGDCRNCRGMGDATTNGPYARRGMGDATTSVDSLINSAFGLLSGTITGSLPSTAAVPPGASNLGATLTSLTQYLPYIIGGYVIYRMMK